MNATTSTQLTAQIRSIQRELNAMTEDLASMIDAARDADGWTDAEMDAYRDAKTAIYREIDRMEAEISALKAQRKALS